MSSRRVDCHFLCYFRCLKLKTQQRENCEDIEREGMPKGVTVSR